MRDKAMWEADADLLYVVEEKNHHVDLTVKGRELFASDEPDFFVLPDLAEAAGEIQDASDLEPAERQRRLAEVEQEYALKNELISNADQLLKAYSLYEKDVEYVMQEGKVVIVDRAERSSGARHGVGTAPPSIAGSECNLCIQKHCGESTSPDSLGCRLARAGVRRLC